MKKQLWMVLMVASGVGLCSAQEGLKADAAGEPGAESLTEKAPWRISGGLLYRNYLYEHDAFQLRAPSGNDLGDAWENGDTSGSGYGFRAQIGRGDGQLNIEFLKSEFDFSNSPKGGHQAIGTTSRDLEMTWQQIRGRNEQSEWGSALGFRYIGSQKDVEVTERSRHYEDNFDVTWMLLVGGYNGRWEPFGTSLLEFHGKINFMLGDVSGKARSGKDVNWSDGVPSETYGEKHSLGYGANASFGMDVAVTKRVTLSIDYLREWLYSFDSTDTGIVVFPDNSDALFIENQHAVVGCLSYRF